MIFQALLKKIKRSAVFGASLDYIGQKYSGRGGFGEPYHSASKFENGLVGYKQPSSIDIPKLRSESRKALIDSPELIALARTLKTLVIGDGLKISSAPERSFLAELKTAPEKNIKEYREIIDTLWEMCADSTSFDILGDRNLNCLMQDAFEKWIQDGEVVILFSIETDEQKLKNTLTPIRVSFALPEDLKCNAESKGKIKNGHKVQDGIELDETGVPIAYWVREKRVEKISKETGRVMVSILKNGQTLRGMPPLACVIQEAKSLQDYQLAEVQKNALASQLFMTAKENQSAVLKKSSEQQLKKLSPHSNEVEDIVQFSRQGVNLLKVSNHDQLSAIDTPKPVPGFTDFTTTVQKRICMTLGMSRDIVTKDTSSSYSAARFQAQLTELEVCSYRMRFVDTFLRPLYENWFRYCVEAKYFDFVKNFDNILQKKSWMAIEVIGRPLPDLSPLQESKALQTYLEMGVLSRNDIAKMMGFPKWQDTFNTLLDEQKEMDFLKPPESKQKNWEYDSELEKQDSLERGEKEDFDV